MRNNGAVSIMVNYKLACAGRHLRTSQADNKNKRLPIASAFLPAVSLSDLLTISQHGSRLRKNFLITFLIICIIFELSFSSSDSFFLSLSSSRREIGRDHDSSHTDRRHGGARRMRPTPVQHLQLININRVTMSTIFNFLLFSIDVRALKKIHKMKFYLWKSVNSFCETLLLRKK